MYDRHATSYCLLISYKFCGSYATYDNAAMAAKSSTAVGSASWIASEKENVMQLLEQEKEEVIYPAQHEMEWLNEHMAEIFSRNQLWVDFIYICFRS